MVQMAEELGPFQTMGTSGCPLLKGVVASVQGIWKVEPSPISQLTQNKQDEALEPWGSVLCSPPWSGHPRNRKAQRKGAGTSHLAIHPIPCSC